MTKAKLLSPLPKSHRYGVKTAKTNGSVNELLCKEKKSSLSQVIHDRKEMVYKNRDPLGRTRNRGTVFPACVHEDGFRFGRGEEADPSNTTAEILFNKDSKIEPRGLLLAKLNEITRPINRNYKYPDGIDPAENRFGGHAGCTTAKPLGEEGVTETNVKLCMEWSATPEEVSGKRPAALHDTKPVSVEVEKKAANDWGARECIMGVNPDQQGEWDSASATKDLGKSMLVIRYGLKNKMPEGHTFGVASSNMVQGGAKCFVSDPEIHAGHLLAPKRTDSVGKGWEIERSATELQSLALETGLVATAEEFAKLRAEIKDGALSLASLHAALLATRA